MPKPRRWLVAIAGAVVAAGLAVPPSAAAQADEPIQDPLPDPVPSSIGLTVTDFAQFPKTELTPPPPDPPPDPRLIRHNRINFLGEVPDGSGRLYVPDLNGRIYLVDNGVQNVYLDIKALFPDFFSGRGLGSGSGFVTFHPDFKRNGKLYTVHTENGAAFNKPTTWPSHANPPFLHSIITEWTATDPTADTFSGTSREIMRIGEARQVHAIQQIDFNPYARPGSRDYGILYVASGDGGRGATTTEPLDLNNPYGKVLRINPLGTNGTGGQFGIPADNPFVNTPGALGEIYASGMRDPHRFSWDPATGRMYLANIGEHRVEAVYEVKPGDNYGWSDREGPFVYKRNDPLCSVYPLPADDAQYGFTYPVAAFDHNPPPGSNLCSDSGHAISGGFVYRGSIPELRGKYVFTDLVDGRVFYTEASQMRRGGPLARIHQFQIYDAAGQRTTFQRLVGHNRVDLRFGQDRRGELYLLAKANGKVWKVTGTKRFAGCQVTGTTVTGSGGAASWAPVTPAKWQFSGDQIILAEAGEARPGPRRPFEYAVLNKGPELSNVRVDAKVRLDTPVEVTNRDVIIVFGYRSDTEFYYAHLSTDNTIYPHNGIFVVNNADRLRIDDQWSAVMSRGASPAITDAEWHDVSVTRCADSGEIAVRVDGKLLMTAKDTTFASGRTGFGSFDNVGRVRNFRATGTTAQG